MAVVILFIIIIIIIVTIIIAIIIIIIVFIIISITIIIFIGELIKYSMATGDLGRSYGINSHGIALVEIFWLQDLKVRRVNYHIHREFKFYGLH